MNKRFQIALALLALLAGVEFLNVTPSFARGGAANIMDSPGYQRRLQESRQQYRRAASQPVVVYPVKPRYHHRRHRHYH